MNNENKSTVSISFNSALQITFIVLKLCGKIKWSWFWVFTPTWIVIVFVIVISIVASRR